MKRLCAFIIVVFFLLSCVPVSAAKQPLDLSAAKAALLCDADTGSVILEKNAYEPVEVAGLKRLPALLTVCRAFDQGILKEEDTLTVSSEAAAIRGATAFLAPNEHIAAGAVLKAAVMLTAGDAVCTLLQSAYPGSAAILEAENAILSEIGAKCRMDDPMAGDVKISLADTAKICLSLKDSPSFLKYSSIYLDTLTHENASPTELTNPNRLVRHYSGCFGLATGSVGASEYSGAFIARRGSSSFLAITAGSTSGDARFALASSMLDYAFASFRRIDLGAAGELIGEVPVKGGAAPYVNVITGAPVSALMPVVDTKLTSEAILPEAIEAPVVKGSRIGTLIIKNASGETVGEVALTAAEDVFKASFSDRFMALVRSWLRI